MKLLDLIRIVGVLGAGLASAEPLTKHVKFEVITYAEDSKLQFGLPGEQLVDYDRDHTPEDKCDLQEWQIAEGARCLGQIVLVDSEETEEFAEKLSDGTIAHRVSRIAARWVGRTISCERSPLTISIGRGQSQGQPGSRQQAKTSQRH